MTVVNFNPGQQAFQTNLDYQLYMNCLKSAIEVIVERLHYSDGDATEIAVRGPDGQVHTECVITIPGNPFGYNRNDPHSFFPAPGGATGPAARGVSTQAEGEITGFSFGSRPTPDARIAVQYEVTGMTPISAADFISILTDYRDGYTRFASLLDDDTIVNGSAASDRMEVGAGDDIVNAGDGFDYVYKWKSGDLTYRGGDGTDILDFGAYSGTAFPTPYVRDLLVNLAKGTGKSPYGGDLILKSVETIYTTSGDDTVIGSKRAETVRDDYGGANTFRMGGGADTVSLFSFFEGTLVDGGAGVDKLSLNTSGFGGYTPEVGYGRQVLNLSNPDKNLFDFAGVVIRNVEEITVSMNQGFIHFDLIGSKAAESLTVSNFFSRATTQVKIDGKGGNDTILGGYGKDFLFGGTGDDSLTGRDGDDTIRGGAGRDILIGGTGNDRLLGEAGADIFVFAAGFGRDRVIGFQDGLDKLDFSTHEGLTALRELKIRATDTGVAILDGDGGRVDLLGIDRADIDRSDFIF